MKPEEGPEEERLRRAVALLEERLDPAAIVLFGSRASGRSNPKDFDLGVLSGATRPAAVELARMRTDLEDVLGSPVDLALLDDASPILRMEILRDHRVLALQDAEAFEDFTVRTVLEYIDLKRIREPIERALLFRSGS